MKHTLIFGFLYCLLAASPAGQISTADTANLIVDTLGTGEVDLNGRVYHAISGTPISGAIVAISGRTVSSGSDGSFILRNVVVPLLGGAPLIVSSTPIYNTYTTTITITTGTRALTLPDIKLVPVNQTAPVVRSIFSPISGLIPAQFNVAFELGVEIDWRGLPPGMLYADVNGQRVASLSGAGGPKYQLPVAADLWFEPSLRVGGNVVKITAVSADNYASAPVFREFWYVPGPSFLRGFLFDPTRITQENMKLAFEVRYPEPFQFKRVFDLPVLGKLGAEFQYTGAFEYDLKKGNWELWFGNRSGGKASGNVGSLQLGETTIKADAALGAKGTSTRATPFALNAVMGKFTLAGELKVGKILPLAVLPPAGQILVDRYPKLKKWLDTVSIDIIAKPQIKGQAAYGYSIDKKRWVPSLEATGYIGMEGVYAPDVGSFKPKLYFGGEPRATLQLASNPLKEVGVKLYLGMEGTLWGYRLTFGKLVLLDWSYGLAGASPASVLPVELTEAEQNWRPMDLSYQTDHPSRFVANSDQTSTANSPAQTDLLMATNVYEESNPSLGAMGEHMLLCYVRPRTAPANPLQPTEIVWSAYGPHGFWTVPNRLVNDDASHFAPQVAFYGDRVALCVFQRVRDSLLEPTAPDMLTPQMELAYAGYVWNEWGGGIYLAGLLTDNEYLDHDHHLVGPVGNGELMLLWTENEANQFMGTGAPGQPTNSRVVAGRYRQVEGSYQWVDFEVVVDQLTGELSTAAAGRGNTVVYVWSRDMDGNLADATDTELFSRTWDAATATWGPIIRRTNDNVPDGPVKIVIGPSGELLPLWLRGQDLVMAPNFLGTPTVVRANATSAGFSDSQWIQGADGKLVLVWSEMTGTGPDLHCRVFDPAAQLWSEDCLLTGNANLESSLTATWTSAGNLALAYVDTSIIKQDVTVALEGGGSTVVPGVPQPGARNLHLLQRSMIKDLRVIPESVSLATESLLPGTNTTITTRVENAGNLAVENAVVAFYLGDPAQGGTLIANQTQTGWWKAGEVRTVSVAWAIPTLTAAPRISVVVDPANAVAEADESNNTQTTSVGGTDLELNLVNQTVRSDGSARVVVSIRNLGQPSSPITNLRLWPAINPGVIPLWSDSISVLVPNANVEIPIDLPAGSVPEISKDYQIKVDEENISGDVNADNNSVGLTLSLFIDLDRDGIPAGWETANGFSDSNPADATQDTDRDGYSNAQEWIAGTNPRDGSSFLKVSQISSAPTVDGPLVELAWPSVEGRTYTVERSLDLQSWTELDSDLAATPPTNQLQDTVNPAPPSGHAFYRVRVR
jgi:hypothetical protein